MLLLRVALGVGAGLVPVVAAVTRGPAPWSVLVTGLLSTMLVVGLLTPICAIGVALLGLAATASMSSSAALSPTGLLGPAVAIAVAMLGPGAYSIDARVFGRREIVVSQAPRR